MLTLTSEYALRAMVYLAQHEVDWPIPGRRIAEEVQIPAKYLSKVLGDLVRAELLTSAPGKRGGFRLRRPARKMVLRDILAPFESHLSGGRARCPFGGDECGDKQACQAHSRWKRVIEAEERFLKGTSLYDVAVRKRKRRPPA